MTSPCRARRLNHRFIAGEGKSTPVGYSRPGYVDREAIDDIVPFIARLPRRRTSLRHPFAPFARPRVLWMIGA